MLPVDACLQVGLLLHVVCFYECMRVGIRAYLCVHAWKYEDPPLAMTSAKLTA